MSIRFAISDADVASCFPVMVQLRPHLREEEFVTRVRDLERNGYRLALLEAGGRVQAVAGYRILEMLSRGRFLYVDDLVTDEAVRSQGHGAALLDWLHEQAREAGCRLLDLDSGVQRTGAHRFYFGRRMHIASYHFSVAVGGRCACPS